MSTLIMGLSFPNAAMAWDAGLSAVAPPVLDGGSFYPDYPDEGYLKSSQRIDLTMWAINDAHDPFVTPYPYESKVYYKHGQNPIRVNYTADSGVNWWEPSWVRFHFDDGTGSPGDQISAACVCDPQTLLWKSGSEVHEVMFFTAKYTGDVAIIEEDTSSDTAEGSVITCFEDGSTKYGGIIAAVLYNSTVRSSTPPGYPTTE